MRNKYVKTDSNLGEDITAGKAYQLTAGPYSGDEDGIRDDINFLIGIALPEYSFKCAHIKSHWTYCDKDGNTIS